MNRRNRKSKRAMKHLDDPALRLSPEVVSYIFQFSLPQIPFESGFKSLGLRPKIAAPLILGAVCREWRRIAWSTPGLWTFILIRLELKDLSLQLDIIRNWILRSGELPLRIRVFQEGVISSFVAVNPLIEMVNQVSRRWYALDLYIPALGISLFNGDQESLSSTLHSLRLLPRGSEKNIVGKFKMQNLKPSPVNVSLYEFRFKSVDILWGDVTSVNISAFQIDECLELLKQATKLQRCKLENAFLSPDKPIFPIHNYIFIHHRLEDFELSQSDTEVVGLLLGRITLPALQKMSISISPHDYPLPAETLTALLQRSSCQLKEFELNDSHLSSESILSLLEDLPSLERLHILPYGPSKHTPVGLFRRLAQPSTPGNGNDVNFDFLPKLEFLRYEWYGDHKYSLPPGFSWDLLEKILGPRSEGESSLRRPWKGFRMDFFRYGNSGEPLIIDEESIHSLRSLLHDGLDLKLRYEYLDIIKESMDYHGILDSEDEEEEIISSDYSFSSDYSK